MQDVEVEVKLKQKTVEVIKVPVFDNTKEAIAALGEEASLSLINRQHKADLSNKTRAKYRPSATGKKKLSQLAFQLCNEDEKLKAELAKHMGDFDGMTAYLDSLAEQVKAKYLVADE